MNAQNQATVIIPCFNVEEYIEECLDSVKAQGASVHHTYVVDNNSSDDTVTKVKEWQTKHPNFSLTLRHEKKSGAPAARNSPMHLVETKWIQFLDADDLLLPNKIEEQIKLYPKTDAICAGAIHLSLDGTERPSVPESNIPLALIRGSAGNTCSNIYSTASIKSINGWNELLLSSQEYDLMFRLWQTEGKFAVDSEPRALIRERESGQISQRNPSEKWISLIECQQKMLKAFNRMEHRDEKTIEHCYQAIFDRIRTLAVFDLDAACKKYKQIIAPTRFIPSQNQTNSKVYIMLFRVIGFAGAENIRLNFYKFKSYVRNSR